jgi:FKBP-type peptidyl-prolyl cis-trans isomerase
LQGSLKFLHAAIFAAGDFTAGPGRRGLPDAHFHPPAAAGLAVIQFKSQNRRVKFSRISVLGLLIFAPAIGGFAGSPAGPTNAIPSSAAYTDRQLVEAWGWVVAQQEGVAGIKISRSELASWMKGFSAGVRGQPAPGDFAQAAPDLDRLSQARRAKLVRAAEKANEAEAKKYFKDLERDTNVIALPGGVRFEIIKPGAGPHPKPQQTIVVHYTGFLPDGTEFVQYGPADMILITNHAPFPAWAAGMQRIGKGGVIKFHVPPPLPEQEADRWGVAPGSAMIFEAELLDVRDTDAQALADALVPPAPEVELPPSGLSGSQLFEMWGWAVAKKTRAAKFNLKADELAALAEGIQLGIKGKPCSQDLKSIAPAADKFVNDHLEQARRDFKRKQLADMEDLFAGLKANTNVVEQPDGLRYEILAPGGGPHPKPGQYVSVNYVGRFINGKIFDRTDPSLGPLDIKVGTVFPGWNEGVQKIGKGGKIKLFIPPSLGCGEDTAGGIPPDSTLIYEIELLDIQDTLETKTPPANDK